MTWELNNSLNWEPLDRGTTFTASPIPELDFAKYWKPIPAKAYLANSRVVAVGVRNQFAKSNWFLGVWVSQKLLILPDSGSDFPTAMQTRRFPTRLRELTLLEFPDYERYPYLLSIDIPKWHKEIYLEVWEYVP